MKSFYPFLIISLIFSTSCSKSEEDCCVYKNLDVGIQYLTPQGEDLFKDSAFSPEAITIHYKVGDSFEPAYRGQYQNPKMYTVVNEGGITTIRVFVSDQYFPDNTSVTLIELNESITDTLKAELDLSGGNEVVRKVWYNGELREERPIAVVH